MSFTLECCKLITDSVGDTESFSTKRSPILRVWLTVILRFLVLRLDCPWTLSYQGRITVNFIDANKFVAKPKNCVFWVILGSRLTDFTYPLCPSLGHKPTIKLPHFLFSKVLEKNRTNFMMYGKSHLLVTSLLQPLTRRTSINCHVRELWKCIWPLKTGTTTLWNPNLYNPLCHYFTHWQLTKQWPNKAIFYSKHIFSLTDQIAIVGNCRIPCHHCSWFYWRTYF